MRKVGTIVATVCALILASLARAQTFPTRPIKLIVPTGPGAATDLMARVLADGVAPALGQAVVVENMAGAAGIPAHQFVARAPADGYTLLFTNTSGMAINLIQFKQLNYDPTRDFTPVALVTSLGPQMISASAKLPVSDLAGLVAYAKANPGKLSIGYDNTAGAAGFVARLFNKRAGLDLAEAPYKSAGQMLQDVAGGDVAVIASSIAAAEPLVQAGQIRRLAVASGKRFPTLPDVPSLSETLPGLVSDGIFAVVAPTGTPADTVTKLNGAINAFLEKPDMRQRVLALGLATEGGMSPQAAGAAIAREQAFYRGVAKELNVEAQ